MEKIKIEIPKKSEYISTLRLTTSSLASKLGFNVDSLEDIKMIISEVCIFLIKNFEENNNPIELEFILEDDKINLCIKDTNIKEIEHDIEDMSIMIIKSLSDEVVIKGNKINITKNKLI
jgi:serine/threonine-protein kinase RsbW